MTGCAAMPCDPRQASRQPLPRPTPRLRPPAEQRFAPPPQAILASSRPPQRGSPQPPGHARRPLRSETASALRQKVLSLFPVPADLTPFGLPVLGRYGWLRDRKTRGRFARPREHHFELRAVGRQTLRDDCLGPPAFFSVARSRSDLASLRRTG